MDRFLEWSPIVCEHGKPTKWLWVVWHPEHFLCGLRVDIGAYTAIFAHHGVTICDDAQIGSHCAIYSLNTIDGTAGRVIIGKGAAIGSHCTIMPGVTIGDFAKVGAHSLVKQDIASGALAYGVPARVIAAGQRQVA
jgi:acetyltransferase-like isoleucine patch superfamily enzyme